MPSVSDDPQAQPRSAPYWVFRRNLDQTFLLARLLEDAGLRHLGTVLQRGNQLSERVAGVDMRAFTELSGEDQASVDQRVTSTDERSMAEILEYAEQGNQLALETVPRVLLIFLVTAFEAYLEDLLKVVGGIDHAAIASAEQGMTLVGGRIVARKRAASSTVAERVAAVMHSSWDKIITGAFEQGLGWPIVAICTAANTSPRDLDRIKVVRNLVVHRAGTVDAEALQRLNDATLSIGDRYPLDINFLNAAKDKLFFLALGIDIIALAHYPQIGQVKANINY